MASDTSLIFRLIAREEVSEGLNAAQEKFGKVGTAIAAGVGLSFGSVMASTLDVGAANSKLAAQLGLGAEDAAKVAGISAKIYANDWGDSTETVNAAIKGVYTNIGEGNDAWLEATATKATAFSDIFEQDVGGTTAAVGQMLRTGLASSADEAFDILTAGMQNGSNKADDLLDTFNEYPTQFRSLGLSGTEAMGLISQAVQNGARDSDLAADALKEFGLRGKDLAASGDAYKALGLNATDMVNRIAGGGPRAKEGLSMVIDALKNVKDPAQKAGLATALFGTQSEDLQKALDGFDLHTAASSLGDFAGSTDKAMATMGDNPAAALETAKRKIQQKLTEIGAAVIAWGQGHMDVVKPLAIGFAALGATVLAVKGAMMVYNAVTTVTAAVSRIASTVQEMWTNRQRLAVVWTRTAAAAQWLWNAAMSANPIMLVVIGIAALVAGLILAWQHSETFRRIVTAAFDGVKTAVFAIGGAFAAAYNAVVGFFVGVYNSAKTWLGTALNFIKSWWPVLLIVMTGGLTLLPVLFAKYWRQILGFFQNLGSTVIGFFSSAASWLLNAGQAILSGLWTGIKWYWDNVITLFYVRIPLAILGYFAGAVGWLVNAGRSVLNGLWTGVQWVWNNVLSVFYVRIPLAILGYFAGAATWLLQKGRDIFDGFRNGVWAVWGVLNTWFSQVPGFVANHFTGALSWLYSMGQDIIRGLENGVVSMASSLLSKVKSTVMAPINAAKGWLGINSPSKVWAKEVGSPIGEGVAYGVDKSTPMVSGAVEALLGVARNVAQTVAPDVVKYFPTMSGGSLTLPTGAPGSGVSLTINVSSPLADRAGIERLGQQLLPAIQREFRTYTRYNGSTGV